MFEAKQEDVQTGSLQVLVARVAEAYFSSVRVTTSEITTVILQIGASLSSVSTEAPAPESRSFSSGAARTTAAQVRKSITPDALISFEDGRPYKTLGRHLSARGLTPAAYRAKWGLPPDYPMVAESYSATRAEVARRMGLSGHGLRARKGGC